jgi:hypothetical protein
MKKKDFELLNDTANRHIDLQEWYCFALLEPPLHRLDTENKLSYFPAVVVVLCYTLDTGEQLLMLVPAIVMVILRHHVY